MTAGGGGMESFEVDPVSAASPNMAPPAVAALQESIATLGQLVPIVLFDGRVIDGRKRLAACRALGLEPKTVTIPADTNPTEHALALNLLRHHYSTSQRAMYVSKLATLTRGWNAGKKAPEARTANSPFKGNITHPEAAALVGVNCTAVRAAKRIARDGAPEIVQAVERGDLTLHAAQKIIEATPLAEQSAVAARVIATKTGKRNTATAKALGQPTRRAPGNRGRAPLEFLANIITKLHDTTDALQTLTLEEMPPAPRCEPLVAELVEVMVTQRRYLRWMKGDRP